MSRSFEFSGDLNRRVQEYAQRHDMSAAEAVRVALALLFVSDRALNEGYDIAVIDGDKIISKVDGLPARVGASNG